MHSARRLIPLLLVCAAAVPAQLSALEPETSTFVSQASLALPIPAYVGNNVILVNPEGTRYFGISECQEMTADPDTLRFITATFTTTENVTDNDDDVFLFDVPKDSETDVDCTTMSTATCSRADVEDVIRGNTAITFRVDFDEFIGGVDNSPTVDCLDQENTGEYFVRLQFENPNDAQDIEVADVQLILDLTPPEPPSDFDVLVTEERSQLSWTDSMSEDVDAYVLIFSENAIGPGVSLEDVRADVDGAFGYISDRVVQDPLSANQSTVSFDLRGRDVVWATVTSRDDAGNFGTTTTSIERSVIETTDFWDAYREAGGAEQGCTSAPVGGRPAALWLLGLVAMVCEVRRTRRAR